MTSKFVKIRRPSHRLGDDVPLAAVRWHDFGDRPAIGRPFGNFSRAWRRKSMENWLSAASFDLIYGARPLTPSPRPGAAAPPFPPVSARPWGGAAPRRHHIRKIEFVAVTYRRLPRISSPDRRDGARPGPGVFFFGRLGAENNGKLADSAANFELSLGPGGIARPWGQAGSPTRRPRPGAGLPRSRRGRSLVEPVLSA